MPKGNENENWKQADDPDPENKILKCGVLWYTSAV